MEAWALLLPALLLLLIGYSVGMAHGHVRYRSGGADSYCPRCVYYMARRAALLRELSVGRLENALSKEPWERDDPPAHK